MSEFEQQVIVLLSGIKDEISAIRETMNEALETSQEKSAELMNSVFGFLQPNEHDDS